MALPKPTEKPEWTDANPAVRVEPSAGKKNTGWGIDERPAREFMNWLLYNIGTEWINYLESVTDAFIGYQSIYAAFVGTGGLATHATINDAMADVAAGDKILVLESATINTPQVISKNRVQVDFLPKAIYTKGTAQYALQIQADYCRVNGGEFEGFNGGSDAGVRVDAAADFAKISGGHFRDCTAVVDDANGGAVVYGTTEE